MANDTYELSSNSEVVFIVHDNPHVRESLVNLL